MDGIIYLQQQQETMLIPLKPYITYINITLILYNKLSLLKEFYIRMHTICLFFNNYSLIIK